MFQLRRGASDRDCLPALWEQEVNRVEVMQRLHDIEVDLATRQPKLEADAGSYFRAKRDWEKAWASSYLKTEGTVEERRQKTILAMWSTDAYKALVSAEAAWEAAKAVERTLSTRASIGQSLLRAMAHEGDTSGVQPSWSRSAA